MSASACASCAFPTTPADTELCPRCGAPLVDPLVGVLLGDRYRIGERIGLGGMGAVYRGQHVTLKREIAVKVLLPELGGKDEFVRRFEREAESASRLAHPNIIEVSDFGRTPEGLLFLVMEYLAGQSLTSVIKAGPLPAPRAIAIVRQILSALDHAHAAGIVHRDLKPDNIMLIERDGRADVVKILDFGIAKVTDAESGREALTQAGVVYGTPEYLSPEQALGDTIDARADLYATGVILYEMLTGRRPFESEDKVRIISMHLSHAPPTLAEANPSVVIPPALEELVMQALEKHRDHRFASAAAFLAALDDAADAGDTLTDTTPAIAGERRTRGVPRRRLWLGGIAVAAVIGVIAIVAGVRQGGRSNSGGMSVATGHVPRPSPTPSELVGRIKAIEGMIGSGEAMNARLALEQLQAEHPDNARVRYLLGRIAFAEGRHAEAIDDYREAIARDASYRGDSLLLEHVGIAVGEPRVADAALDLAIERVGKPALDIFDRVANGGGDLRRRERAARALDELGEGRRVDRVALRISTLKRTSSCEDKKPIVVELGKSDDLRALPALKAQRPRGGIDGLLGGGETGSACMKTELADAIARLEAKLPPEKRTPARRSSSRSSLFGGR